MHQKYWYLIITNVLLEVVLFFLFLFHVSKSDWLWSFFTLIMLFISIVPALLRRFAGIDLPLLLDFFVALALIFHVGNGLLDGSAFIDLYNKFTHFFSAIVVAFISLLVLYVVHEFEGDIVNNTKKVLFDIIIITIALGVVWELLEWGTDILFDLSSQVNLDDTMLDLVADTLGGIVMAFIGFLLIKRGVLHPIAKDIKEQIEKHLEE